MNPKQQRSRGRSNGGGSSRGPHGNGHKHINIRVQTFDSNGPEGRIRGNAHQVMEKYLALARDASAQGDRVIAENFYQHAEHYLRLINAYNQSLPQPVPRRIGSEQGEDGVDSVADSAAAEADAAAGVEPTPPEKEVENGRDSDPVDGALAHP